MIRTLLVDDSGPFLVAAGRAVGRHPRLVLVGEARSGAEALTQIERLHPTLVLLDLMMPGLNGLETVRVIKQQPFAPCVVLVTFYDEPLYRDIAADWGADGFVAKTEFAAELPRMIALLFPHAAVGA